MVLTPWGPAGELRDRMLSPGPGTPRDEVVDNQRERLFGAMVASVAERGYADTRVGDLVALSGVSSRTFYDLFADKRDCFLATMEAIIQAAVALTGAAVSEDEGSWEDRARRGLSRFARIVAAQPAAARLCLLDAYAAGPQAVAILERSNAAFEEVILQLLAQSPERADMPPAMVTANVGAMQEVVRARLSRGEEEDLPTIISQTWDLILSYRPPPEPLRLAVRAPAREPAPDSFYAFDHAERALQALAAVVAERGYTETTIDHVVRRASMSTSTFYAYFDGKEDALLAAIESGAAQMIAAAVPAYHRAGDWATGIRAGFGALLNYLAFRPAFARLIAVEVYAAGPVALEQRARVVRPLGALIGEGIADDWPVPPMAAEGIAGSFYTLLYRTIRTGGPEKLPSLAPVCTYLALAPFIGPQRACEVANGDGRRRLA